MHEKAAGQPDYYFLFYLSRLQKKNIEHFVYVVELVK